MLNTLDDHHAYVSERGPSSKKNEAAMLAWLADRHQHADAENDVDTENHLVLPVDRRRDAVPQSPAKWIKPGNTQYSRNEQQNLKSALPNHVHPPPLSIVPTAAPRSVYQLQPIVDSFA